MKSWFLSREEADFRGLGFARGLLLALPVSGVLWFVILQLLVPFVAYAVKEVLR